MKTATRLGRNPFTIIEPLVVVAIVFILAMLVLPPIKNARKMARNAMRADAFQPLENVTMVSRLSEACTASQSYPKKPRSQRVSLFLGKSSAGRI